MKTRSLVLVLAAGALALGGYTLAWAADAEPAPGVPEPKQPVKKPRAPKPEAPKVGDAAPLWTLKDAEGKTVKLEELKGQVVLMDFWATWCGPCRAAMPHVQKVHERHADKGVVVLGMNVNDNSEKAQKYMEGKKYTYRLILNAETIGEDYGIEGIPAFFIVDREGKIAFTGVGSGEANEKAIDETIAKLLAQDEKK